LDREWRCHLAVKSGNGTQLRWREITQSGRDSAVPVMRFRPMWNPFHFSVVARAPATQRINADEKLINVARYRRFRPPAIWIRMMKLFAEKHRTREQFDNVGIRVSTLRSDR
jgi:hypothetical protein